MLDRRNAWGEDRVYFHDDAGRLRRLPTAWTNVAAPDSFVARAAGRACFRIEDLLQLVALIARQREAQRLAKRGRGREIASSK